MGHTEKDDSSQILSPNLSRRLSTTSSSSSASRIPAYTPSFFSRGKPTQTEGDRSKTRSGVSLRRTGGSAQRVLGGTLLKSEAQLQHPRMLGLGITAANPFSSGTTPSPDQRQRNVLRRKASSIDQHAQYARAESSMSSHELAPQNKKDETGSSPGGFRDPYAGSILGVAIPAVSSSTSYLPNIGAAPYHQATSSSRMANYNSNATPHALSTKNLPPPTPSFAHSSGSSTRRSESPGAFSRTSTPTSMSSHSPGIPLPAKSPLKARQISPTRSRPPVTRRRIGILPPQDDTLLSQNQGLPALRESGTSSSSSSTVKGTERIEGPPMNLTTQHLSPSPPSPPPRHSSKKFLQAREEAYRSRHPLNTAGVLQRPTERTVRTQIAEGSEPKKNSIPQSARVAGPPPRPSRENIPKLDDNLGPSLVIQSNLDRLLTSGHKRRESLEKAVLTPDVRQETIFKVRPTLGRSSSITSASSIRPSRLPSPNPASATPLPPRPAEFLRKRDIPLLDTNISSRRTKDPSLPSAGPSKSLSRFGLFTRRTKSSLEPSVTESDKAGKKGPTAGTGHEGYGKYAKRGRSGSASTSASRGRSTSTGGTSNGLARTPTSRKSSVTSRGEPEMDDFLLERLAPVVISGGGGPSEPRDGGAESFHNASEDGSVGRPSNEGYATTRSPAYTQIEPPKSTSSLPSYDPKIVRKGSRVLAEGKGLFPPFVSQQNTEAAEEFRRPTLAARRSLHRSQLFKEAEPMKIPAHINTQVLAPSPFIDSSDAISDAMQSPTKTESSQIFTDDIFEGREGHWLKSRKTEKRARSPRKWNFFQRTHATPKKAVDTRPLEENEIVKELPVIISRIHETRPVAHYAMLDSNDQEGSGSAVTFSSDADKSTQAQNSGLFPVTSESETNLHKDDHKFSMLLPSPPNFSSEFVIARGSPSPVAVLLHPNRVTLDAVVPDTPPKPKEPRLQQVGRIPRVISKRDRLHKPPPQSFSRPFMRAPAPAVDVFRLGSQVPKLRTTTRPILGVQTETLPSRPWVDDDSAKPESAPVDVVIGFSPPSQDEFLAFPRRKGSEVSGSSSSGILNFAATTAVIPEPGIVASEDEVWDEYDELLDTVESRIPLVRSNGTKSRKRYAPAPLHIRKESSAAGPAFDPSIVTSYSPTQIAPMIDLPSSPKRSNLLSPLQSAELAATPLSFSDFFAGYGDRNRASAASKLQSVSSGSRYSATSVFSESNVRHSRDTGNKRRNTEIMAEKTEPGPGAQSNLRFSALMTSRWLSFGRVLFSPAHMEIQSNRHDRVLVLDGLGNDDWSFYCALTYPDATVYNLSPFQGTSDNPMRKQEIGGYQSPSNHRQIYHTSIAHPFPFPKGFFTAVVFRFPVASSEGASYNAISECKRVLRPGGYLEMSILDLDMVNMGNRARRAVRELKLRMQSADPDVSLKPASDNIQKMLGRRGFENLNRCIVNVPIAGHISDSRAASFDEKDLSLGDMLKDSSRQGDEGVSKMVAKVGRWWYTRCYEMGVLPHGDMEQSIWADRALVRECEKRETGLKLLICFAQKPSAPKRRTVSV